MNIFVGNLNEITTGDSLRTLFAQFGEIVSSKIILDPSTGMPRGFGFVEMADKFHGMDAIDNLDATYFEGNIISVKEAKQNNGRGGSGGNRPFNRPNNNFRRSSGFNSDNRDRFNRL